jgi:serpin B
MSNTFAGRLYAVFAPESGNIFFSPSSISTTLAMTYAGASGETAREMEQALSFTLSGTPLHAALRDALGGVLRGSPGGPELRTANRLWPRRGLDLEPAFIDVTKKYYAAPVEQLDFRSAAEASRGRINGWVARQTMQKIPELLKPGMIDGSTEMVLTNAVYFKGVWAQQFKKTATRPKPFTVAPGTVVQAPLMHGTLRAFYGETAGAQVLELPYRAAAQGPRLALVVILPKQMDGLAALEMSLATTGILPFVDALSRSERKVEVTLPRFKTSWNRSLNRALQTLGMQQAFTANADFSGMTRNERLFISLVQHEAFVDVNEEGTEAAAATGAVMRKSADMGPVPFRADHPFLYLLRDTTSGLVLFMGRLANPH